MDNLIDMDDDSDRYTESDSELYFTDDFEDCEVTFDNFMEMEDENYSDLNNDEDIEIDVQKIYWQESFKQTLNFQIWKWALKNNITHAALSQLLKILIGFGHLSLPKDSRTLLRTPKKVRVINIGSGQLWYRGLEERLTQICMRKICPDILPLEIHIDGTPIYKSSKSECWPIQCSVKGVPMKAFFVTLHQGPSKPKSAEEYLRPFIAEIDRLSELGLSVSKDGTDKHFTVEIDKFIMDAPARQFLKRIVGHAGYSSCERCTEEGVYIFNNGEKKDRNKPKENLKPTNKNENCKCGCKCKGSNKEKASVKSGHVCLVGIDAPLRTNLSFRTKLDEDHHHDESPLEDLPIDMIHDFPLDYLHLILFGIVKKLLQHWMNGTRNFRTKFCERDIIEISEKLIQAGKTSPSEINRPNRSLKHLSDWKATEYRTFVLKTGPVVLRGHLSAEAYSHFLALHCATTICCSESLLIYLPVAKQLFREFNIRFGEIYGDENYTYSVHSIVHVTDDVDRYGVMDSYSAFPGESNLGHLKKLVRGGNKPLQQIVKRLQEKEIFEDLFGDLDEEENLKEGLHNNVLQLKDIKLDCSEKNRWILTKEKEIFKIEKISEHNKKIKLHGSVFPKKNQKNVYDFPIESSNFGIFKSKLEGKNATINLEDMNCKMYRIEMEHGESAFFPLFHFTQ